jgi:hypothetical protein
VRRISLIISIALVLAACGQPTSTDTTPVGAAESTTTTSEPGTTTTTAPPTTSTTTPPTTTTTEGLPVFPPGRESLEHGGLTWAVVLAASTDFEDPHLASASLEASVAGYRTGATDCDLGVIEALGLSEDEHWYSVSVYFDTEADAIQARDAFKARGVDATVAELETYCLD